MFRTQRTKAVAWVLVLAFAAVGAVQGASFAAKDAPLIRSAGSGLWSAASTWEGGKVPGAGDRVQVRTGHTIVYDVQSAAVLRLVHVAGTLHFAHDKDTRLEVGLIKIQAGENPSEDGFDGEAHGHAPDPAQPRPTLEVGTPNQPIDPKVKALIRLVYLDGMNKEACPAIVCCGGRMDFHGAPLHRTWIKLGETAKVGTTSVTLAWPAGGWRVGDRIILSATTMNPRLPSPNAADPRNKNDLLNKEALSRTTLRDGGAQTEERIIKAVHGAQLTLDEPLVHQHLANGAYSGEVANLSRNVTVESADPAGVRGHTMYHRHSAGSISYAEFRHLGKEGVLGRYPLHFHLVGDTMRGSSVLGASIWDSHNRWLTIHGTQYLVVRDCVGYQSVGHGFYLENGTEVYNVLDHNLAVLAWNGKPLPRQELPYDTNDGAGFWWANSQNSFTGNVACECDTYGYFFQAPKTADFDPVLPVQQSDGATRRVDIRTLPFIRCEDNESHAQRLHGFNLGGNNRIVREGANPGHGGSVEGVGPDAQHPFVIRNMKVWDCTWAIQLRSPSVLVDNIDFFHNLYYFWFPNEIRHCYRYATFQGVNVSVESPVLRKGRENPSVVEADYPKPLDPIDDFPPVTVVTHIRRLNATTLHVRGTTTDNGNVRQVWVNGEKAMALTRNFAEWGMFLKDVKAGEVKITAHAEDAAGNVERRPHVVILTP